MPRTRRRSTFSFDASAIAVSDVPITRTCNGCHQEKPASDFSRSRDRKKGFDYRCKSCVRGYHQDPAVKQRSNELKRAARYRLKRKVLSHYSSGEPQCSCCAECRFEFLVIDHENGGGNKHREAVGSHGGWTFYQWLVQNNYPPGFRVLCHNCNASIGLYGYCPHTAPTKFVPAVFEPASKIVRGTRHHATKLTVVQVTAIKVSLAAGERQVDIASRFGVTRSAIEHIAAGHTWKHVNPSRPQIP